MLFNLISGSNRILNGIDFRPSYLENLDANTGSQSNYVVYLDIGELTTGSTVSHQGPPVRPHSGRSEKYGVDLTTPPIIIAPNFPMECNHYKNVTNVAFTATTSAVLA